MLRRIHSAWALPLLFWACASELPEPRFEDIAAISGHDRASELAELRRGRELVVRHCAGCHALKVPSSLPKGAWDKVVEDMRRRRGLQINERDATAIVTYMNRMALDPN